MRPKKISILLTANIFLIIATIGAYCAPAIEPNQSSIIALLGLTFPAIAVAHVLIIVIWMFLKPRYALLSVVTLLLGFNHVLKVFSASIEDTPNTNKTQFTVASFNCNFSKPIAFLELSEMAAAELGFQKFLRTIDFIDILCVQEHGWRTESYLKKASIFPYQYKDDAVTVSIYSKFPIINKGLVNVNTNIANACLWADLLIDTDTVRVYSAHLESNRDDGVVPEVIEQEAPEDMSNSAILGILKHYPPFSQQRTEQGKVIKAHLKASGLTSILCGDFNDGPMTYTSTILGEDMQDTFIEEGIGIGSTFGEKIPALRIDYILVDPTLEVLNHQVFPTQYSDHHLISSKVEI